MATGGPLALVALYVPGALSSTRSIGLVGLLAFAAFVVPVAIWYRYSAAIVSSGGLYSFVEAAAGRRVALVQGAIWIVSYFLYLPYTIDYVVYDLLPQVFPGIGAAKPVLELVLPAAVIALALLGIRTALQVVAGLAVAQLALVAVLFIVGASHVGLASSAFGVHGATSTFASATANVSLLYVCTSLPLYLGGELVGGPSAMRKGLAAGFGISGLFVALGALVWARAGSHILASPIPGTALAQAAWGHPFAVAVGVGVAVSVGGIVIAEYLALSRLLHCMTGKSLRTTTAVVAGGFLVSSALSLINPTAFYSELLKPSLVALWVSQVLVFLVYPRFAHRQRRHLVPGMGLAAAAAALMSYGLYQAFQAVTT